MAKQHKALPAGNRVVVSGKRGVIHDVLSTQYFIDYEDGTEGFAFYLDTKMIEPMSVKEVITHIAEQRVYEPKLCAAAKKLLKMDKALWPEALARIRKQTKSIVLQYTITGTLGDGWVATTKNSAVQPYREA